MDACTHHPTRCGRAARYKLPLVPLMNSPVHQPRSAQGWDSSCFCATHPDVEQERSVLLTLEAPCKPSHSPAGTPGKLSPLGQGHSQSEPVLCCRAERAVWCPGALTALLPLQIAISQQQWRFFTFDLPHPAPAKYSIFLLCYN